MTIEENQANESLVILVDENDNQTGVIEKLEAHKKALLHRAVSVFIFTSDGRWLLQRRAFDKYHSSGLWTNTCCTHPRPGESDLHSAERRLTEEMGISCHLEELFSFTYKEPMDSELTEHELDHVFAGICDDEPDHNTSEVHEWKKISYEELHSDIIANPDQYTYWFREIYQRVYSHLNNIREKEI
jgi:isopentenyl-diphosphate delta-isomerase